MGLYVMVEKVFDVVLIQDVKNMQWFGFSEVLCDEGSFFLVVESVLENDGGKLKEDYKFWVYIFLESVSFFIVFKDWNSYGVVQ